jgi:type IV pilus assembly protein PilM
VLAGLTFNYFTHVSAWSDVNVAQEDGPWEGALRLAKAVKSTADGFETTRTEIRTRAQEITDIQKKLTSNVEGRVRWLELLKAVDAALPKDERPPEENAEHVMSRNELHITAIDNQFCTDIAAEYFTAMEPLYTKQTQGAAAAAGAADASGVTATEAAPADAGAPAGDAAASETAPTGEGWVIQLTGYHFHNADQKNMTRQFVETTLVKQLKEGSVQLPDGPGGAVIDVPIKDLAIHHAFLVGDKKLDEQYWIDPDAALVGAGGSMPVPMTMAFDAPGGTAADEDDENDAEKTDEDKDAGSQAGGIDPATGMPKPRRFKVKRYEFVVQFIWQPNDRAKRAEIAAARAEAQRAAAEAAAAADGEAPPEGAALPEDLTTTP